MNIQQTDNGKKGSFFIELDNKQVAIAALDKGNEYVE